MMKADREGDLDDPARVRAALSSFASDYSRAAAAYMESCVHCGQCADACHFYVATRDPKYTPIRKIELFKRNYSREAGPFAWAFKALGLNREVGIEELEEWQELLYDSCTQCGRCTRVCPMGIDIAELVGLARHGMFEAGLAPRDLHAVAERAEQAMSPLGATPKVLAERIEWLTDEHEVAIPLDRPQAEILVTLSSIEIMKYPLSLVAIARIMAHAGADWTISTHGYEATNFGMLAGSREWQRDMTERIVGAALASIPFLGTEFMPRLDEGTILIEMRQVPSVALDESVANAGRVERALLGFPEVASVVTKIGRPDLATEAMGIYQGDMYVGLHPMDAWTTGRTKEALIDAMAATLGELPGLSFSFTQPMAMRLDEVVSGIKTDVAVKIFGPDARVLERLGAAVHRVIAEVPGAADAQVEILSGAAQIEVRIDREAIARYGLNVADVQDVVEAAIGGIEATEFIDGARRVPIIVRLPPEARTDAAALAAVTLAAPGGERVRLDRIAEVVLTSTPEAITHENAERRLVVQANVRGRDVGSFVAEAERRLDAAVPVPPGYYLEWGGQFENQQRAMRRLALVVPLSLVIIFVLLMATFGRVRWAVLILVNVPFALVGGIAALWLRGLTLNLSASVGFIALFGIAVLNGVVMIAAIRALREEEAQDLREATLAGAGARLKPVLMTALVAAIGFVPMALSQGAGAEVQRPLATVVIGGIVTSTLLTLIVLPTLYEMMERWAERRALRADR